MGAYVGACSLFDSGRAQLLGMVDLLQATLAILGKFPEELSSRPIETDSYQRLSEPGGGFPLRLELYLVGITPAAGTSLHFCTSLVSGC